MEVVVPATFDGEDGLGNLCFSSGLPVTSIKLLKSLFTGLNLCKGDLVNITLRNFMERK